MTGSQRHICTIVAKNYVSFARTLCESFLSSHSDGRCHVLFIDETRGFIDPSKERFGVYHIENIGIPDIEELCFRYNITELATAVKPFFLRHLLSRLDIPRIVYLDPDILVLADLGGIFDRLDVCDVLLTPHLDTDYPDDGKFPDDSHILRSGVFNLGFIGVRRSANTHRFLDWWAWKMRDKCIIDHGRGYFVDQRFIDLAFTLFDGFYIEKDVGYNVAYWNLHSRRVTQEGGCWLCNGKPLRFFHFSNYKPEVPTRLSAFQNRIRLSRDPALQKLFSLYTDTLNRHGYGESRSWPYSHGKFADGSTITDEDRRVYRVFCRRISPGNPFDRSRHPFPLRAAMRGASLLGTLRRWLRNRAMRIDGPIRRIATFFYGNFPTADP